METGSPQPTLTLLFRVLAILAGIILVAFVIRWLFGNSCKKNSDSIACSLQRVASAVADTVQTLASNLWVIIAGAVVFILANVFRIKIHTGNGKKGDE